MRVLLVLAHPEPPSLICSLHQVIRNELEQQGHETQTSDLYRMKWKSHVDREDFTDLPTDARLRITTVSSSTFASDSLTEDVKTEQAKILWADTIIFIFPLWWFNFPAILKGWIDRVFTGGFAYNVKELNNKQQTGWGGVKGKRAMLVTTLGGRESAYTARGFQGPIDDILFPIHHGVLHYPGFQVLPPIVVFQADRIDSAGFDVLAAEVRERMRNLGSTAPIQYRAAKGGDYAFPELTLRDGLERKSTVGFALHLK
ncbi:flavoprotein-like protein [Boeremia exigua]|uniref:flavoprotein-like protein n=1 Tax=Boeremia exigua TaxID=749465 RepID=UPI001E8EE979|nr:flavoprotein-like protein [Boeremia exigua]KAH6621702.1 flavoprotein-like protein [Boeremia exigua]